MDLKGSDKALHTHYAITDVKSSCKTQITFQTGTPRYLQFIRYVAAFSFWTDPLRYRFASLYAFYHAAFRSCLYGSHESIY